MAFQVSYFTRGYNPFVGAVKRVRSSQNLVVVAALVTCTERRRPKKTYL